MRLQLFFWQKYLSNGTQLCRWLMIALFMSYVDLWIFGIQRNFSICLPPCFLPAMVVLLLFVPRDHITDHTTQLALLQACCILVLLGIFLYIWFLLLGLPLTFCWPGKYVLVFCVLVWASVVGKPATPSSMPLLCVHHAYLLSSLSPLLDWEPPNTWLFKTAMEQCLVPGMFTKDTFIQ